MAILYADYAVSKAKDKVLLKIKSTNVNIIFSGSSLGLAFLSHYGAIFFLVPVSYLLAKKCFEDSSFYRKIIYFILVTLIITASFYVPYILSGYTDSNLLDYLARRMSPIRPTPNILEMYRVYNPGVLNLLIFGFAPLFLVSKYRSQAVILDLWFTAPLIMFEVVFSNSGTHIQHYVIPMIAMTAIGADLVIDKMWKSWIRYLLGGIICIVIWVLSTATITTYIPYFSNGYPSNHKEFSDTELGLFLYGFPYNRGWGEISNYLNKVGAHTFYTSDNVTISSHYARGIYIDKFEPEYYVKVFNNQ